MARPPRQPNGSLSRRTLLKMSATAAAGAAAPGVIAAAASRRAADEPAASDRPRRIIFLVADGMSGGVPALAEAFSRQTRGQGTHWHRLARDPAATRGQLDVASASSLVPDSASSSSAWGGGLLVNNASINMTSDGRKATPIGRLVRQAGLALGLVTTTRLTDATPAGFAAVAPSRSEEQDIAGQYLEVVDVLIGGGGRHFEAEKRLDRRDLRREFVDAGFQTPTTRRQLAQAAGSPRVLGLLADNHLPYVIDRAAEPQRFADVPTLSEMTIAALASLSRHERGFLLQIEAARVDHAAHANDAAAMLHEQIAFDDAIGVCLEFAREHSDTLIVVTTDHACGNPGLMGFGARYARSSAMFRRLAESKASFETIGQRLDERRNGREPVDPKVVIEVVARATGIELTDAQAGQIAPATAGENPHELNRLQAGFVGMLGQALGQHHGVGFISATHTSDWVPLLASGPGAERFNGLRHATEVHSILTDLVGLNALQR